MMSGGSKVLDRAFQSIYLALDDTRKAIAKESPRCVLIIPFVSTLLTGY
jgi:hypothetical protein